MKKVLLLSLSLIACQKENESIPVPVAKEPIVSYHRVTIKDNTDNTTNLYINGTRQSNITDTITVKSGDVIQVANVGYDTWVGSTKTDGYVSVQVLLDNDTIYNVSCVCDVLYSKSIK